MNNKKIVVMFRRKREQKTNYLKRMKLLTSRKPRLVIRKSLKNVIAQIIEYSPKGDKIITSAHSKELKKLGWDGSGVNLPACYLIGFLLGKKALKAKVKDAILDTGLQKCVKGNRIYSCLKGVIDSGLKVPASDDIFPTKDRIEGKHISDQIVQKFNDMKKKIEKGQ